MFKVPEGADTVKLRRAVNRAEHQYRIRPDDYLEVRVYTNKGERILDPNGELMFGGPSVGGSSGVNRAGSLNPTGGGSTPTGGAPMPNEFLVQRDGQVKLPMVDMVPLGGLTLYQADSVLQVRYTKYYKDVFVATRVTNNRVIVLGIMGGRVVPLNNENMNVLEVLAYVGGMSGNVGGGGGNMTLGRATNIRLIRGDLKNPQVEVINLQTIEGMRRANLQVEPNDVIYVEPIQRPFLDAFRDYSPIVTGVISAVAATLFFFRL